MYELFIRDFHPQIPDERDAPNPNLFYILANFQRRESEASKNTEISDADDTSVFETDVSLQTPQKETQASQEDIPTIQEPQEENSEVNMAESENPVEVGIVNRGRSSIDSGTNVEVPPTLRKNSVEQTSYC